MGILAGKKILITGLLSNRSIAYGVAKACVEQGAEIAITYQSDRFLDRAQGFAQEFGTNIILPCDVTSDEQINNLFTRLAKSWDGVDGLLHSLAYTPKEGISGDFVANVNRDTFKISSDISSYSYLALARAGRDMMKNRNASMLCLTYLGGERVLPNYNMAGVSKAALEATSRYMAYYLGAEGIRVNAISAGPIKTLAASGIAGFSKILDHVATNAPLKRNVTIEEVGNTAAFLFSSLASGITGEIIYVDAGYNIVAAGMPG
ncbi:MAG: SDR family oxidoreductase [Burkholderiales bacterium]|nr:SDR family oxidoreductase [Burkholderiales bacterium]